MKIHFLQKLIRNDPDTKLSYDVNVEYGVNVNLFFFPKYEMPKEYSTKIREILILCQT